MRIVTKKRTLYKYHTRKSLYKCLVYSINFASDQNSECAPLPITDSSFLFFYFFQFPQYFIPTDKAATDTRGEGCSKNKGKYVSCNVHSC